MNQSLEYDNQKGKPGESSADADVFVPSLLPKESQTSASISQKKNKGFNQTKHMFVVLHYKTPKLIWDWIVLALTLYTSITVPFVIAFHITSKSTTWLIVDSIIDFLFIVDVGLNFCTSYIDKEGKIVTDLKLIGIRYASSWFAIDLLSCLPYDALTLAVGEIREQRMTYLLGILKACRLLRMMRIARDVDRYLQHSWATLMVLICMILLISHWMACGWYAISLVEVTDYLIIKSAIELQKVTTTPSISANSLESLLAEKNLQLLSNYSLTWTDIHLATVPEQINKAFAFELEAPQYNGSVQNTPILPPENWLLRLAGTTQRGFSLNISTRILSGGPHVKSSYIACLYFTLTTITSVGFGNIAADTRAESIYCVFIMLAGGLLYAVILGDITNILQQFNSENQQFLDHMKAIDDFAKLHDLPDELKETIRDYVSYKWTATHGICVETVLKNLPEHKQAEVCVHLHQKVFIHQPVFGKMDGIEIRSLAKKLHRLYIAPGDIISDKGEQLDSLYFVISGSLEVIQDGYVIAILNDGDSFGTYFWTKTDSNSTHLKSKVTVQALTYVSLDVITEVDLQNLMKKYPVINEAFKTDLTLTYNLNNYFNFRTVSSVLWEKEAASNPAVFRKLQRIKKWLLETRKKRNEMLSKQNATRNIDNITKRKQKLRSRDSKPSRSLSLLKFGLKLLSRNKISVLPSSSSSLPSDTINAKPISKDVQLILQTDFQKEAKSVTMTSIRGDKTVKQTKSKEEAENPQNEEKFSSNVKDNSIDCEISTIHTSCDKCGKPVRKVKTKPNCSSNPNSSSKGPCINKSNDSKNRPIKSKLQKQTLSNDVMITATSYLKKYDACGKIQWISAGKTTFSLESKEWMKLPIPKKVKQLLQNFLNFQHNLQNRVFQIEKKLEAVQQILEEMNAKLMTRQNYEATVRKW